MDEDSSGLAGGGAGADGEGGTGVWGGWGGELGGEEVVVGRGVKKLHR